MPRPNPITPTRNFSPGLSMSAARTRETSGAAARPKLKTVERFTKSRRFCFAFIRLLFGVARKYHARMTRRVMLSLAGAFCALNMFSAPLRIGIIGLDTSHVTAFTSLLNNEKNKDHVPGGK